MPQAPAQLASRRAVRRGFTILELAVVLGCVSILVAIGVPEFQRSLNRARAVEAIATINTIERQLVDYYNRYNQYPSNNGAQNPVQPVSAGKVAFTPNLPGWSDIGFSNDGSFLYRYDFETTVSDFSAVQIHATTIPLGTTVPDDWYIELADGYRIGDLETGD